MHELTDINQIPGILGANAQDIRAGTGCTVIICPEGATGAIDVRGGAPATRETDLLRPEQTVQRLHAVVLSGGSAYGLAASCGVADELERHGIGLDVGVGVVPIVGSACVFDLACGDSHIRPDALMGAVAARRALNGHGFFETGNFGAGTGCTVGKSAGLARAMKGGLGTGMCWSNQLVCGAVAAVNAGGNIIDPATGKVLAGILDEKGMATLSATAALDIALAADPLIRSNTTISCVVTNARLTKAQATKVAQMAADAYAHVICPAHTTNDGDAIFVMATGGVEAGVDTVGILATKALECAIVRGIRDAKGAYGYIASCDLS